ncbi:site-specific integrase [Qiania dongpingensis]|uniref:Site-specific integrase n=1 Tax=Qiania dongpingensis TaxID=2763669 RepID=A0A7G9G4G2_9FIRM|nr:site-specific integrase [Qiania dongpingensis]QNM05694.1 site-specific integrase [Qiania dongpingensis]
MKEIIITEGMITCYQSHLVREEKSPATIEKYNRDVRAFSSFLSGRAVSKELTVSYKRKLAEDGYAVRSINSILVSINRLLAFLDRPDCVVKTIRTQRQTFLEEEKELTKAEYYRLLRAAKGSPRLCLLLQTICGTGIRVSELQYFNIPSMLNFKSVSHRMILHNTNYVPMARRVPRLLDGREHGTMDKAGIKAVPEKKLCQDLTGKRFGKLLVLEYVRPEKGTGKWKCRCDCGNITYKSTGHLNAGTAVSCGCVKADIDAGRDFKKVLTYRDGTCIEFLKNIDRPTKSTSSDTGVRGVRLLRSGKYNATITFRRHRYSLGTYTKLEDAVSARKQGENMVKEYLEDYNSK